jgi:hypothetical protein
MNALTNLLNATLTRWREERIGLEPPATDDDIETLEMRLGVKLPAAFEQFLRVLGGMKDGETDRDLMRFWPLRELVPLSDLLPTQDRELGATFLVFADWSISALHYGVGVVSTNSGLVVQTNGVTVVTVAPSFKDFLDDYLEGRTQRIG